MKQRDSRVTDGIEKFKSKLADELGIIEQTDRKDSKRNTVKPEGPPHHRQVKCGK